MSFKKQTGSYYTPEHIASSIVRHLKGALAAFPTLSILEPSVGDGTFVKALSGLKTNHPDQKITFTGIELIEEELVKARTVASQNANIQHCFLNGDFLELQNTLTPQYQLVIGNPPYISKKLLSEFQVNVIENIHAGADLLPTSIKNIWTAFLVRGAQLLSDDGIMAYILPAEILQVSFAKELRDFINMRFERIEVFTFSQLLFDCAGQDTVLLIAFKKHQSKGHFYTHIKDVKDFATGNFRLQENEGLQINGTKWSHHALTKQTLELLYKQKLKCQPISNYCEAKPGIVTAANNFFIVDQATEKKFNLQEYTKNIVQKGAFVNGSVVFDDKDLQKLAEQNKPTKLLDFGTKSKLDLKPSVLEYLASGETLEIQKRYKCEKRSHWYQVPNVATPPDGFFFKRSHQYPKLLKNEAAAWVTDSAYKVVMTTGYNINSLVYSFYNSLTLLFAELNGRFYGGGVLELVPSEFKGLPLPYTEITDKDFRKFKNCFEIKNTIQDILLLNDEVILRKTLGMTSKEIAQIQDFYLGLVSRRLYRQSITEEVTVM